VKSASAWSKADLFFLLDALKHGVAEADVARFLGRSVDEVREKSHARKRSWHPDSPAKRNSARSAEPVQRGSRHEGQ
jgi:hypothetical protein